MEKKKIIPFTFILVFLFLLVPTISGASSELISLDFKNTDIKDVLRALANQSKVSIIVADDTVGNVTLHLSKVTLSQALEALSKNYKLNCVKSKNVYYVSPVDNSLLKIEFKEGFLTVEARDANIKRLYEQISQKTGFNLVPSPDLQGKVSILINHSPLPDAIKTLLTQTNCMAEKIGKNSYIRRKTTQPYTFTVDYEKNLLTVDANAVPIRVLARAITEKTSISVIPEQNVAENTTIYFQNLPFTEGIEALCQTNNLKYYKQSQSNCYFIKKAGPENKDARITFNPDTKLFNLDIRNGALATVINEMAQKADVNMVILSQVNWPLSNIRLRELTLNQALDFLLKGTVYSYKISNGIYMVGDGLLSRPENADFAEVKVYPMKYIKAEQLLNALPPVFPRQNFMQVPNKNTLVLAAPPATHNLFQNYLEQVDVASVKERSEMIKICYLKAEDVLKLIPSTIPKNNITLIKENNALVVTGIQSVISQVKNYIATIDQVTPLIVFDISVLQISNSDDFNFEGLSGDIKLPNGKSLKIGTTAGNVSYVRPESTTTTSVSGSTTTTTTTEAVLGSITALAKKGKAKLLANPTITTLAGYPASFNVTTNKSYTVPATVDNEGNTTSTTIKEYKSGLSFEIVPWVSPNKNITMEIKPKITEFVDSSTSSSDSLPTVNERATETTIRVGDGETFVISGLKQTSHSKNKSKIPFLGDLPLIGYLFQSFSDEKNEDEFVIIVTPRLVFNGDEKIKVDQKINERHNQSFNQDLNRILNNNGEANNNGSEAYDFSPPQ
jgi:type II secretory pathway component GspD/PulD (secretin)